MDMELIEREISLRCDDLSESKRLFHGRGRCFHGLDDVLIDWFEPVALITLYRERDSAWLEQLCGMLKEKIPCLSGIVLQQRYIRNSPSLILWGAVPEPHYADEGGLRYHLTLNAAQNIGFFPDMAEARRFVRDRSAGKRVLNLFAYTCSFSVAALAGGAEQVVNLDMSRTSLATGRLNHSLNGLDERRVGFLALELFRSFSKLKKLAPFDLIVCDPPGDQGQSFRPERDWPRLARKLQALLAEDGELLACVSNPHLETDRLKEIFNEEGSTLTYEGTLTAGRDFPEADPGKGSRVLIYRRRS